ncbi:MAG TPA: hypothetical protein VJ840_02635 [Gemmatimonadaceae bacterium]|nr:hypothetical protein [Gemmatimonadaceae bacterium]
MDSLRLRLTAGLAGVTLAVFAATSYGQQTTTPTTGGTTADQSAPAAQPSSPAPTTGGTDATIGTSSRTTTTATDVTTTTPSTTFWLGPWGIAAIAVVAILLLWAIFGRRGDRTVVRDSYSTTNTTRTAPTNERIVSPRAASGSETTTRVTDTDTRL